MNLRTISIVIPVFNEETTILAVIESVKKSNTLGLKKEIIVVDDASTDRTFEVLKKIKGISTLHHTENAGKGRALRTGFDACTGDVVLIQDADMEYSPEDYPKLLHPILHNDADVVYGSRFVGGQAHRVIFFSHYVANHLLTFYCNLFTNLNLTDMECGYKIMRASALKKIQKSLVSNRFGIEPELTIKLSKIPKVRFYEVGIGYQGRTYDEGKKIGLLDGLKAVIQITFFSLFS